MKLSKRTRYGVRFILELALNFAKTPLSVAKISVNEGISPKFLSQIIIPLKGAGLIQATRGSSGGYELSRPPDKLTVYDVFTVLEGSLVLTDCEDERGACNRMPSCVSKDVWHGLSVLIEERLKAIRFSDLVQKAQEKLEKIAPVYQI